jgi:FKBP-type peptidyl-prolyl cis-trans isomerase
MKKLICFVSIVLLVSCNEEPAKKTPEWNTEKSIEMNEELAAEQDLDIDLFLAKYESKEIIKTGSGLRYILMKPSNGEQAKAGQEAFVSYSVQLLDGTEVYITSEDELDVFDIDNSQIESGIHEGIKRMKVGEKAILVFPSHLAHGLIGDMQKIPPLSPLVVEIELIELK